MPDNRSLLIASGLTHQPRCLGCPVRCEREGTRAKRSRASTFSFDSLSGHVAGSGHLNRAELLQRVANAEGVPVAQVERMFDRLLDVVTETLANKEEVSIRLFGRLEPRTRRPVTRINPRTRVAHDIPEKNSVAFVPSLTLKARLNQPD